MDFSLILFLPLMVSLIRGASNSTVITSSCAIQNQASGDAGIANPASGNSYIKPSYSTDSTGEDPFLIIPIGEIVERCGALIITLTHAKDECTSLRTYLFNFIEGLITKNVLIEKLTEKRDAYNDLVKHLTEGNVRVLASVPCACSEEPIAFGSVYGQLMAALNSAGNVFNYIAMEGLNGSAKNSTGAEKRIRNTLHRRKCREFRGHLSAALCACSSLIAILTELRGGGNQFILGYTPK